MGWFTKFYKIVFIVIVVLILVSALAVAMLGCWKVVAWVLKEMGIIA